MAKKKITGLQIAIDAGGTMTDSFLTDRDGAFVVGKALTNAADESRSYMASLDDAGSFWNMSASDIHSEAILSLYSGTSMLNTLLTGQRGWKIGLLVTRGFEHDTMIERGFTWLGQGHKDKLHMCLHEHTRELVHPNNVKPITGRMCGGSYWLEAHLEAGIELIPMIEDEVRQAIEELLDDGVQSIGIVFLFSFNNPVHEKRAAEIAEEIIKQRGLNVPVVISSDICPLMKENQRLQSVMIQCYAAESTREQLEKVEKAAKDQGYKYDLLTMLAYGGATNIRYPRLYEAVVSGPVGGILGARVMGERLGISNLVCCDMGGTSFDIGVITNGTIQINREPDFAHRRLALPMIALDAVGTGTGTVIRVDPKTKRIELGPDSAGSDVGTCFRYPEVTIGDIDVVNGYLDPDYFLGGTVKLDLKKAKEALQEFVADPLGIKDVHEAGSAILDILHSNSRDTIYGTLVAKGQNPADYTLLYYGGGSPLHMWGFSEGINFKGIITVPWAAAFSAFGNACAPYKHRYQKSVLIGIPAGASPESKVESGKSYNDAFRELEEKAYEEFKQEGIDRKQVTFVYGAFVRYIGQAFSFDTYPLPVSRIMKAEDMDSVTATFENTYAAMYSRGAQLDDAGYLFTDLFIEATVDKPVPIVQRYTLTGEKPPKKAFKGPRDVFHKGKWTKFNIWDMDTLEAGNKIDGPAIIEHPMTTAVIPPGKYMILDEFKVLWYKNQ